jgi:transporter family protein
MVYIFASIAAFFWGCAPIIDKLSLKTTSAPGVLFWRSLINLLFAAIMLLVMGKANLLGNRQGIMYAMLGGLLSGGVGQLMYYLALSRSEASWVVPLTAGYPMITALMAMVFLREPVTPVRFGGILMIVVGGLLLGKR